MHNQRGYILQLKDSLNSQTKNATKYNQIHEQQAHTRKKILSRKKKLFGFLLQSMFVETQPKSGKQISSWTQLIKAFLFQSKLQYNISNQILIYRQNLLKKILKFKVLYLIYSPHVGAKDSYKIHCQYLYAPLHQAVNLCLLILGNRLLIFKHRSNHKTNFFQHRSMCQVAGNPTLIHRNYFSMFLSNWTCFWQFDHATQSSRISNLSVH